MTADDQTMAAARVMVDTAVARVAGSPTVDGDRPDERARRDADVTLRNVLRCVPGAMALVELDHARGMTYLEANAPMCSFLGLAAHELVGRRCSELVDGRDAEEELEQVRRLIDGASKSFAMEKAWSRPDGTPARARVTVAAFRGGDGRVRYGLQQLEDITEHARLREQIRFQTDHDDLTRLFNRRRLRLELERELAACRRSGRSAAVLVLDLDSFKYANDSFGHAAGDDLIMGVAEMLRARLRGSDVLARLGGDEFAVILRECDREAAERVATDILDRIRCSPFRLPGIDDPVRVTASVGVNVFDGAHTGEAWDLLAIAEVAMYQAKDRGGDTHAVHDPADGRQADMAQRVHWVQAIREALEHDRFELFSQPILDIARGVMSHQELLIRLREPDGRIVAPGLFLPIAESAGMMRAIDRWVVAEGIALAAQHRGDDRPIYEINLSAQSLADETLPDLIAREIERGGVAPAQLLFEITETVAITNLAQAQEFVGRLKALGCSFALDDFGAGYGSFYYLKHLPFDYLKIDGEFIRTLTKSRDDQVIVRSIVETARGLNKKTVAEFVEDEETLQMLRAWGVDYAQGYHVAKPAPVQWPAGRVARGY